MAANDAKIAQEMMQLIKNNIQQFNSGKSYDEVVSGQNKFIQDNLPNVYAQTLMNSGYGNWDSLIGSGMPTSDSGLSALLSFLAYNDSDADRQFSYQKDALAWLQTLNERDYLKNQQLDQRDYDRFLQLDERAYNEQMRDEQRAYDSPLAQLQRLMQTGLSRGAALDFLSGSGSGSSALASPTAIGASGIPSGSTQFASPYSAAAGSTFSNYAQGAASIVDSLCQLFGVGINGFQAYSTGTVQQQQARALKMQNDAITQGSSFNSLYQSAVSSGLIDKSKITSFDSARKALSEIPKEKSPVIYDYMHGDGYNLLKSTPMALDYAGQYFDNNNRYGDSVARSRQMMALATAYELKPKEILSAIDKNSAEVQKIFNDILNSNEQLELEKLVADHQMKLIDAQAEVATETAKQRDLENQRIKIALHREQITADDLDNVALYQASYELQIAAKMNSKEVMDQTLESILLNEKQRRAIMAFNCLRLQNTQTLLNQPNGAALLNWSSFYDDLDLGQMFNSYIQAAGPDLLKSKKYAFDNFVASFGIQPRNWFTRGLQDAGSINANFFGQ